MKHSAIKAAALLPFLALPTLVLGANTFGGAYVQLKKENPSTLETCQAFADKGPIELIPAAGDSLSFSIGLATETISSSKKYTFEIRIESTETKKTIFTKTFRNVIADDIGWHHFNIPLTDFSGKKIRLTFSEPTPLETFWGNVHIKKHPAKSSPNVIFISLDTLRADHLGFMGYKRRNTSPNLDALAKRSRVFRQAMSQAPWTKPSHMSMFTGLYPSAHGMVDPRQRDQDKKELSPAIPYLPELLRTEGYTTQAFTGSVYLSARYGFGRGFRSYIEYVSKDLGDADFVFSSAKEWLKNNKDEKFFLFLHTYEIHKPYKHDSYVKEENIADSGEKKVARYDSGILYTDALLGQLISTIKDLKLEDSTILIITSDHGEELTQRGYFDEHGHTHYDEILHVPLVITMPGDVKGTDTETQVELIDLFPTILEMANYGGKKPLFHGRSLLQLPANEEENFSFAEGNEFGGEIKSVRVFGKEKAKLILSPVLIDAKDPDSQIVKNRSIKYKYWNRLVKEYKGIEFYDLGKDPAEKKNLGEQKSKLYQKLHKKLLGFISATSIQHEAWPASGTDDDADRLEKLRSLGY